VNQFGGILVKSDKHGTIQWYKSYAHFNNIYDAEQTTDHGYIVIGDNPSGKTMLMKVDSVGNIQWTKVRTVNSWQRACVHQLPDGGYVFAGQPNIFIVRTDPVGNVLWEKTYNFHSEAHSSRFLQLTPDGGFVVCGSLYQPGGIGLVKIDSLGNVQWEKAIAPGDHGGASVHVTASGYFLTAIGTNEHVAILADSAGNALWAKQWPVNYDIPNSISESPFLVVPNGNELICYGTRFLPGQTTTHVFRFDTAGNILWSRYYGTSLTNNAPATGSCIKTYGNGLALTIHPNNSSGILIFSLDSTAIADCNDSAANFSPTPFPVSYGTSSLTVQSLVSAYNSPTLSVDSRTTVTQYVCTPLSNNTLFSNENTQAYPNPADEKITLQFPFGAKNGTLTFLDISGRVVGEIVLDETGKAEISTTDFSPGLYLWKYIEEGNVMTGKFCVQH
jgi:hypothetical protein